MKSLYWVCSCGEKFEELSTKQPGSNKGWMRAVQHQKQHKDAGEPDRLTGLYDEDGNLISDKISWVNLVHAGILQGKPKKDQDSSANGVTSRSSLPASPMRGKGVFLDVPMGPITYLVIQELLARDKERYPDDSPQTLGRVLEDICIAFSILMADEIGSGAFIRQALVEAGWVRPAVQFTS